MLNRIYIVVGVLAILALAAAFIVPRLIQWGDYRERMELIASEVLGTDVKILGDIEFTLLPAPQLKMADVVVGPKDAPVVTIAAVEADFSLVDFLRDRYTFTHLVLNRPVLDVTIDESGQFQSPLKLADQVSAANVAVNNATIVDGSLRLFDKRSSESFITTGVAGEIRLTSLQGPFQFQGRATYGEDSYGVRFTTSTLDANGATRVTAFLQPDSEAFSLSTEGLLITGLSPKYEGTLTYRQAPPVAEDAKTVQGDLLFESQIQAVPDKILLSNYTMQPDENRPGTRLTGAAVLRLGKDRAFDAVISGGVFALPPRDAREEAAVEPYELVRLLAELPAPPLPGIAGTISADIAELNLRGVSLRDVRLDASTDARSWTIQTFEARLAGDTSLKVTGALGVTEGRPSFDGTTSIKTERLDALALLWRKASEGNPLFGMTAELDSQVALDGDTLAFTEGTFLFDGVAHRIGARIDFGPERHLGVSGAFDALSPAHSAALMALVPHPGEDAAFAVTFPEGNFSLTAARAEVLGLTGTGLVAEGTWKGRIWQFDRMAAMDFGGLGFDLSTILGGTLADPRIAGNGSITVKDRAAPGLALLFDTLKTPLPWREFVAKSLPADMAVELSLPSEQGGQVLAASGRLGVAEISIDAQLAGGITHALDNPLALTANFSADDPAALSAQFGLANVSLFPPTGPVRVNAVFEGEGTDEITVGITADGGQDAVAFDGSVNIKDPARLSGNGQVRLSLSDASGVADIFGASGVYLPPLEGTATVAFNGSEDVRFTGIAGAVGAAAFGGDLSLLREGGISTITGALTLPAVDASGLLAVLMGPASLIYGNDPYWPDGPISVGDAARTTRGDIAIATPGIMIGGKPAIADARFGLVWDDSNLKLRELTGRLGGGTISLDAAVCCTGPMPEKQFSGRATLLGVDLDTVLPPAPAGALGGMLQVSAKFDSTGDSIAAMLAGLTGEGSFGLDGLSIQGFDPRVFPVIAGLKNILELEPEALTGVVRLALEQGAFEAPELSGVFTIAGGSLRSANLSADGRGARLFGGAQLNLRDLGLGGSFTLTPLGYTDPNGLINESTSRVTANLTGSLLGPEWQLDVGPMVDAIKVKAYELEVDRLEALQAEDEARQRAAAAERQRLIDEQARIAAEEEARKAAEVEAARQAEAKRLADEQAEALRQANALAAQQAEEQRRAEEQAAQQAEAQRLADEQAEAQRLADEKAIREAEETLRKAQEQQAAQQAAEEAERQRLLLEQQQVLQGNDSLMLQPESQPAFPDGTFQLVPPADVGSPSFTSVN